MALLKVSSLLITCVGDDLTHVFSGATYGDFCDYDVKTSFTFLSIRVFTSIVIFSALIQPS